MNEIDKYISNFPIETQAILTKIRETIKTAAPDSLESIAYGMPAYKLNGKPLVYFAGYKNHVGLYATPAGHARFSDELSKYKQGKGSVQFPLKEAIPYDLIRRIVEFRADENKQKTGK
ncbi:MAG: hypothetical protein BGN96_08235 [Bacteroidales bacterium 45-6]|nr:MAG: hypothetical protein BGN96_08235 [Bacteroidales bacterium 45-6]